MGVVKRSLVMMFIGYGMLLATGAGAAGEKPSMSEPVAEVDGVLISNEEVEKSLGAPLAKLQEEIYQMKRQRVEALINEKLLAKEAAKSGMAVPALLDAEVTGKVGLVMEQEVETFYQANKGQFKGEAATVHEQIRAQLQNRKLTAAREAFLRTLRAQAQVAVHLKAPPVFRTQVRMDGGPAKGPATALVTIVKFEDFHCPFCKRVQPAFTELLSQYDGKLKLVHRDFPLDQLHPQARKAHEAGRCAEEQGKFWAYHDVLYANSPKASLEQLNAYAQEVGLDMTAFRQCMDNGKFQATVQQDVEEGTRAGVTGTPAFFINGRMLSGAQPVEKFVQMIDEELARATGGPVSARTP